MNLNELYIKQFPWRNRKTKIRFSFVEVILPLFRFFEEISGLLQALWEVDSVTLRLVFWVTIISGAMTRGTNQQSPIRVSGCVVEFYFTSEIADLISCQATTVKSLWDQIEAICARKKQGNFYSESKWPVMRNTAGDFKFRLTFLAL